MLSNCLKKYEEISLEEMNKLCMNVARVLVKEGYEMENLADLQVHIMELVEGRLVELGGNAETNPVIVAGLLSEMSLFLGIQIGIEFCYAELLQEESGKSNSGL